VEETDLCTEPFIDITVFSQKIKNYPKKPKPDNQLIFVKHLLRTALLSMNDSLESLERENTLTIQQVAHSK